MAGDSNPLTMAKVKALENTCSLSTSCCLEREVFVGDAARSLERLKKESVDHAGKSLRRRRNQWPTTVNHW